MRSRWLLPGLMMIALLALAAGGVALVLAPPGAPAPPMRPPGASGVEDPRTTPMREPAQPDAPRTNEGDHGVEGDRPAATDDRVDFRVHGVLVADARTLRLLDGADWTIDLTGPGDLALHATRASDGAFSASMVRDAAPPDGEWQIRYGPHASATVAASCINREIDLGTITFAPADLLGPDATIATATLRHSSGRVLRNLPVRVVSHAAGEPDDLATDADALATSDDAGAVEFVLRRCDRLVATTGGVLRQTFRSAVAHIDAWQTPHLALGELTFGEALIDFRMQQADDDPPSSVNLEVEIGDQQRQLDTLDAGNRVWSRLASPGRRAWSASREAAGHWWWDTHGAVNLLDRDAVIVDLTFTRLSTVRVEVIAPDGMDASAADVSFSLEGDGTSIWDDAPHPWRVPVAEGRETELWVGLQGCKPAQAVARPGDKVVRVQLVRRESVVPVARLIVNVPYEEGTRVNMATIEVDADDWPVALRAGVNRKWNQWSATFDLGRPARCRVRMRTSELLGYPGGLVGEAVMVDVPAEGAEISLPALPPPPWAFAAGSLQVVARCDGMEVDATCLVDVNGYRPISPIAQLKALPERFFDGTSADDPTLPFVVRPPGRTGGVARVEVDLPVRIRVSAVGANGGSVIATATVSGCGSSAPLNGSGGVVHLWCPPGLATVTLSGDGMDGAPDSRTAIVRRGEVTLVEFSAGSARLTIAPAAGPDAAHRPDVRWVLLAIDDEGSMREAQKLGGDLRFDGRLPWGRYRLLPLPPADASYAIDLDLRGERERHVELPALPPSDRQPTSVRLGLDAAMFGAQQVSVAVYSWAVTRDAAFARSAAFAGTVAIDSAELRPDGIEIGHLPPGEEHIVLALIGAGGSRWCVPPLMVRASPGLVIPVQPVRTRTLDSRWHGVEWRWLVHGHAVRPPDEMATSNFIMPVGTCNVGFYTRAGRLVLREQLEVPGGDEQMGMSRALRQRLADAGLITADQVGDDDDDD